MRLHVLPALHGDAMWLEYGKDDGGGVLIDGGPKSKATTERVRRILEDGKRRTELILITHIDADHITGVLDTLVDPAPKLEVGDVWFNSWRHLPSDTLGAKQGQLLSQAITARRMPWNQAFEQQAVEVPDAGPLPRVILEGGLTLTLLSPTRKELAALKPVWKREVERAGLVPGVFAETEKAPDSLGSQSLNLQELAGRPFRPDRSAANGASIAVLAEHDGKSVLLAADAHADVLETQLGRLAAERGVDAVHIDVAKLSHHGSRHNLSSGLLATIACDRWVFSTNGAIFAHPDPETIARLVVDRPGGELIFNYRSESTERFDSPRLARAFGYRTTYPGRDPGISIEI